jgi:hypothetical protein
VCPCGSRSRLKQEAQQTKAQLAVHTKAIKTLVTALAKLEEKTAGLQSALAHGLRDIREQLGNLEVGGCG